MFDTTNSLVAAALLSSLLLLDYSLGSGLVDIASKLCLKVVWSMLKFIQEKAKLVLETEERTNIYVLLSGVLALAITTAILKRYTALKTKDRIDELLLESRRKLRCANEYLYKWRHHKENNGQSYLDEEPQPLEPLKLEVPILHMAIIDTRGLHKRGDAGDTISNKSTLLSVTSLLGDDSDGLFDPSETQIKVIADNKDRYLWNVLEDENYM